MSQSVCILGRQPSLGLAELESLFGADALKPISDDAAILNIPASKVPFKRLGGTIKLTKLLHEFDTTDWPTVQAYLVKNVPIHAKNIDGKLILGLSVYGLNVHPKKLLATGLSIKKAVKAEGQSLRIVPNVEQALNSAQVLYNKLTSENGWELCFIRNGSKVLLTQTIIEQDIDAYAARDQQRPKRDPLVGMLPPKLAQIIVNLATADSDEIEMIEKVILDPFCGTGVILQEALMMGYEARGSDIEDRMVEYSYENLHWLDEQLFRSHNRHLFTQLPKVEDADATSFTWTPSPSTIACETYLGKAFSHQPDTTTLQKTIQDVNTITKKFLDNVAGQITSGFRMCIAVPAWKTSSGFTHLPLLDSLEELGYTRMSFTHVDNSKLIYHREGQIVARELVVLIRK